MQEKSSNTCGGTVWRAARSRASSRPNQDQTGLEVAGCRHALAQKACNMYSGEQYGYPHFLHAFILLPMRVKTLWQDVICQYWPWAKKQAHKEAVETMQPALSVMHSKAHSWDCQVCHRVYISVCVFVVLVSVVLSICLSFWLSVSLPPYLSV